MNLQELKNLKILGVDTGSKKMGFALYHPRPQLVTPLPVYYRSGLKKDLEHIGRLIQENAVAALVVGIPKSLSGTVTPSTENALFWVHKLKEQFSLPIFKADEALSTQEAERRMLKISKKKAPDSIAAQIILEDFINGSNAMGD